MGRHRTDRTNENGTIVKCIEHPVVRGYVWHPSFETEKPDVPLSAAEVVARIKDRRAEKPRGLGWNDYMKAMHFSYFRWDRSDDIREKHFHLSHAIAIRNAVVEYGLFYILSIRRMLMSYQKRHAAEIIGDGVLNLILNIHRFDPWHKFMVQTFIRSLAKWVPRNHRSDNREFYEHETKDWSADWNLKNQSEVPFNENILEVREALAPESGILKDEEREAILNYFGFGFQKATFEEIGKKTGVQGQTVRVRMEAGLRRLRHHLAARVDFLSNDEVERIMSEPAPRKRAPINSKSIESKAERLRKELASLEAAIAAKQTPQDESR